MNKLEEEVSESETMLFKKKLKKLGAFKGKGTELISQYVPPDADRSSVMNQLTAEISQSSNIKSPSTRKNVQGALRRIIAFLKNINYKIPEKGIVVFAGNISETEGKTDIKLFTVKPLKLLKTKLYWCDSEFHLAPLKEMIKPSEVYAIVTIDKNESTIATVAGKKYEIIGHYTSGAPGKFRAGGQCLTFGSLVQSMSGNILKIEDCHNPLSVKTMCLDDYSIEDSPITDKWLTEKQWIYKIQTKCPRLVVESSKDHVFLVYSEKGVTEKAAEELKIGDTLLMPEKIDIKGRTQELNPLKYYNCFTINKEGQKLLKQKRLDKGLFQKELAKKTGLTQTTISSYEIGKLNANRGPLKKLCQELDLDFEEFLQNYTKPQHKNVEVNLPTELNEWFAQFIGYYLGDGDIEEDRIAFSEQSKQVVSAYKKRFDKFFGINSSHKFRESKNYYQLRFTCRPLVRLIQNEFPELKKTLDSKIPQKILESKEEVVAKFLRGYFDAEGYVSRDRLGIASNNKTVIGQLLLLLLRFSIIPAFIEYDNRRNFYSNNPRFSLDIGEKKSLMNFEKFIGFTSQEKNKKLKNSIRKKSDKSSVRQILMPGTKIRELIEKAGYNLELFPKVNNFFRNERMMSKEIFKKSVLQNIKDKKLYKQLEEIYNCPILPVKIKKIEKRKEKAEMVDISVKNQNFIANGLIVHNSAKRFEHLREEAAQDFYKRISEKLNDLFVPLGERLKGVIVGGPGITKNYFLNKDLIDHRLKQKIIGTIDSSYTDESGIREVVHKSEDLLRDTDLMKERVTINDFLGRIARDGLAAYGQKEVEEALKLGKVEILLLSEAIEWMVYKFKCNNCGKEEETAVKDYLNFNPNTYNCKGCRAKTEVIEEIDYADYMLEKAQNTGAEVKVISTDSPEGEQFFKGFGGLGALLRYK